MIGGPTATKGMYGYVSVCIGMLGQDRLGWVWVCIGMYWNVWVYVDMYGYILVCNGMYGYLWYG